MKLSEIKDLLQAEILCGKNLSVDIKFACGSDLMSDVLASCKEKAALLTGLTNAQVIRTAEMIDISAIIFVRGKRPSKEVVEMALEKGIPVLLTKLPMYEAAGILYTNGLKGTSEVDDD
ncbi:MAG: hypothetical protein PWQ82_450 [Thermosediminibacterales bacterium]|nr:hypothetical protein [Thermosediminibacterales bacterium]MDK2835744.1 hypothetical protein [Thermosediminibacterales bacterium]